MEFDFNENSMKYTSENNPYGDEHLFDPFIWKKKIKRDKHRNSTNDGRLKKQSLEESKRELRKVMKSRLDRERQQEERLKERDDQQRKKALASNSEWLKIEEAFLLNQARMRSEIRLSSGRAKPVDLLAGYIRVEKEDLRDIELKEPYSYLDGLTMSDLEDLIADIEIYAKIDQNNCSDFWQDVRTIAQDELTKLRAVGGDATVFHCRDGVNSSVKGEVMSVFKGKSSKQLRLLQNQIEKKLEEEQCVDTAYWELTLKQLKVHLAAARLRERHQRLLARAAEPVRRMPVPTKDFKQEAFGDRQGANVVEQPFHKPIYSNDKPVLKKTESLFRPEAELTVEENNEVLKKEKLTDSQQKEDKVEQIDYTGGKYSPKLIAPSDLPLDVDVRDPDTDVFELKMAREQVLLNRKSYLDAEEAYKCNEKLQPRKPKFCNRVLTGFSWNRYNRTHYDIDNPPPKTVQGYKFNMFYPDLLDKSKMPEYSLYPTTDENLSILRFHAGPPYEDIAFKVVNKEWDCSCRKGFKCHFSGTVFQLWFRFKRFPYRR